MGDLYHDAVKDGTGATIIPVEDGEGSWTHIAWPANTTPVRLKEGPGVFLWAFGFNWAAAARSVKLWDSVAAPTVGTTKPTFQMQIGAGAVLGNNIFPPRGWQFVNGLWVAVTVQTAFAGVLTAPGADDVILDFLVN